jgi:hypothetical protein
MSKEIIEDFLEVDQPIPGQNYVCMSFISPEEVLKKKEVHFAHAFLKEMAKNYGLSQDDLEEKYKDYMFNNGEKLEKEYYEQNQFQTTVRGLKIRGVYDTLLEAQAKAKKLQNRDPNFNVFIGQMGYWLPWDPNPLKLDKQEYAEQELNTLVQKYKENADKKDAHFRENIDYVKEQAAKQKLKDQEQTTNTLTDNSEQSNDTKQETIVNSLEETDPWLARKQEQANAAKQE